MPVVWDDALRNRVKALWPTHSSREIARTISTPEWCVSRSSIDAMGARLGLTKEHKTRDTRTPNPFGMLSDGRVKKAPLQEPLVSRFYAEDVSEANVHGLAALEDHNCRFIINSDMLAPIYCGEQIASERFSWCQKHFERGTRPFEERKVA